MVCHQWGGGATCIDGTEPRDAAYPATRHRTAPQQSDPAPTAYAKAGNPLPEVEGIDGSPQK